MSEMKYKDPLYLQELDIAEAHKERKDSTGWAAQALLEAEAECERLRKGHLILNQTLSDALVREEKLMTVVTREIRALEKCL